MPQGGPHQVADRDRRRPAARPPGREAHEVRVGQRQFDGVLDRQDAFAGRDQGGDGCQQGGLARARAAADEDVPALRDRLADRCGDCLGHAARPDEPGQRPAAPGEFADRQHRPAETAGRQRRRDARAVREPGVQQRLRLGDVLADAPRDRQRRPAHLERVRGRHGGRLEAPAALDEDRVGVQHHFGYRLVLEQPERGAEEGRDEPEGGLVAQAHRRPSAAASK